MPLEPVAFPWKNIIHSIAVANALVLVLILIFSSRLANIRGRWLLAGVIFFYSSLLWIFTLIDAGWAQSTFILDLLHHNLAVFGSAMLLDYVRHSLAAEKQRNWIYIPAVIFLGLSIIQGEAFSAAIRVYHIVLIQIVYTFFASLSILKARGHLAVIPKQCVLVVGFMWTVHLLQILIVIFPENVIIFDSLPLLAAIFLLLLTWFVTTDHRALRKLTEVPRLHSAEHCSKIDQIISYMESEKPYLDSKMNLKLLSEGVEMTPRSLSEEINEYGYNFRDFLNNYRVKASERLLIDPKESRTSIEAVAMLVGFKSRSAFYEAFKKRHSVTPAEFRKLHSPQ
ncbi:MAG: helix-turn-helix domain-containing protein [Kangiellaceae bacterium]|nr:helix-turn-helix domain-containing protein [Kangiellaceae bacterium]